MRCFLATNMKYMIERFICISISKDDPDNGYRSRVFVLPLDSNDWVFIFKLLYQYIRCTVFNKNYLLTSRLLYFKNKENMVYYKTLRLNN